jgi:hypothetical protein
MPPGSTDCFSTWGNGGSIAASTKLNWIWIPAANTNQPTPVVAGYFTNDGGGSWTKLVLPTPMTDDNDPNHGWPAVYGGKQLNRHNLAADRVLPNTFYLSVYQQGIYRSTTGGSTWTLVSPVLGNQGFDDTGFNVKLAAVPGQAGDLFFTSGQQDNTGGNVPQTNPFYRTTNCDTTCTWTTVPGMFEVYTFGFGKVVNGYPRILVVGWYNNQYGVWKSDDNAASWVRLGNEYANDVFDFVGNIDGDKTGDRVFLAMRGSGMVYYNPAVSTQASAWGPLAFNSTIFTGMTETANQDSVSFGNLSHTSVTGRHCQGGSCGTAAWNASNAPCTMATSRIDVTDTGINEFCSNMTITDSFIHACGLSQFADHSDGVLTFTTGPFTETITRTTFDSTVVGGQCDIIGTAIRHGDTGRVNLMKLDHVYVKGGLGIQAHTPDEGTGAFTMHVNLQDVCIENSGILIDNCAYCNGCGGCPGGTQPNNVIVDNWVNVNNCTTVNGQVVVGAPIACSSVVKDVSPGTVTGCPN